MREDVPLKAHPSAFTPARPQCTRTHASQSRHELDRLAADIRTQLPEAADDDATLAVLNRVLFDELGFHGSRGDYYNRSNSYVNEVLDDREGIPISLAVAGPRAILTRMLNNLLGIAVREGKQADVLRYLDAILVVEPESARDRAMRMITSARIGRRTTALTDARWLLDHEPEGIDLDQVRGLIARLESEP